MICGEIAETISKKQIRRIHAEVVKGRDIFRKNARYGCDAVPVEAAPNRAGQRLDFLAFVFLAALFPAVLAAGFRALAALRFAAGFAGFLAALFFAAFLAVVFPGAFAFAFAFDVRLRWVMA
ncbi:MAG: hypothetical protein M3O06_07180 [Pseudomonadota bacterium]|nr:hypothetical protein [Pseudomonadota bacterium]